MIKIENITKKFKENTVLNNVSINFEKGKIHGLIGRNGSGKTVLMKCICGFIPVTSGSITVRNKVISKKNMPENIGLIIEKIGRAHV